MKMIKGLLVAAALMAAPAANAQIGNEGLMWRNGDPFVFCRYGLDKTISAWYTRGNYTTTMPGITPGYCPFPTPWCPYLQGWDYEEILSYLLYPKICRQPRDNGSWEGGGDGRYDPSWH